MSERGDTLDLRPAVARLERVGAEVCALFGFTFIGVRVADDSDGFDVAYRATERTNTSALLVLLDTVERGDDAVRIRLLESMGKYVADDRAALQFRISELCRGRRVRTA